MEYEKWNNAKNVLCVRLDNMGDVIMTSPAFRALKETNHKRKLTLLTSSRGNEIAKFIKEIDDVIVANVPWTKNYKNENSEKIQSLIKQIKNRRFDAAVIFTVYSQNPLPSVLLCYLAEVPLRLAYCRENPYELLTHWVPDPEPSQYIRHEVQRQIDLVKEIGCKTKNAKISFTISEVAKEQILRKLKNFGVNINLPWIIMHPGATSKSRLYSIEGYAQVADRIINRYRCQIIFTGTKEENKLISSIQQNMKNKTYSLAGKLNTDGLVYLISISPIFIGINSGPMHIASAMGIPVIVLYALTNPQHTPWMVPHRVFYFNVKKKYIYNQQKPLSDYAYPLKSIKQVVDAVAELSVSFP